MSANTVAKYIRQLEEKRLIDTEPTKVKNKGRLGAKWESSLHDPPHPGGGELQAGAGFGSLAGAETPQEKMVNPNSALCGPVSGFESCVGKRHQRCPKQALLEPCEPVVNE
jgi:hypothetical protein